MRSPTAPLTLILIDFEVSFQRHLDSEAFSTLLLNINRKQYVRSQMLLSLLTLSDLERSNRGHSHGHIS